MQILENIFGDLYYLPQILEEKRRDRCNIRLKMEVFVSNQTKPVVWANVPICAGGYDFPDRKQYAHCYIIEENEKTIVFRWFNSMKQAWNHVDKINQIADPKLLRAAGPQNLPYGRDERFGFGDGFFDVFP
jgi:hypothetical protein